MSPQLNNNINQESLNTDQTVVQDLEPETIHLTLEQAINLALSENKTIQSAEDGMTGAKYSLVAKKSEFELKIVPGISAGLSGADGQTQDKQGFEMSLIKKLPVGATASVTPGVSRSYDRFSSKTDVQLSQPLLRGLGRDVNLSKIYASEFYSRSAHRKLHLTKVSTVLSTVSTVYQIVRQREELRLNKASVERLRGHVAAAKTKEKIGLTSQMDVYRADIQLKQAEDSLNTARETLGDTTDTLKIILGVSLDQEIDVEAPLEYSLLDINDKDQMLKLALKNRIEIEQSKDTLAEAKRLSKIAKHNTLPQLDLVLNYSRFGSSEPSFIDSTDMGNDSWSIGLASSTDLWRTAEKVTFKQSLLSVKEAERSYSLQIDEVKKQVKSSIRNLKKVEKKIGIQKGQIKQAEGKLELAKIKFRRGLASNFDMIEAEEQLLRARTSLISAVTDYIVGTYQLKAALGTLIERGKF